MFDLIVVGGGLAGCEAAWQAAERGIYVYLYEMRPKVESSAHVTDFLAEIVCHNSLGSLLPHHATKLLRDELSSLGSFLIKCAEETAVPAGNSFSVDKMAFSRLVTERLSLHPNIKIIRKEIASIPKTPAIIASGPLTSPALSKALGRLVGKAHVSLYNPIAPMIHKDSINFNVAFEAFRGKHGGDKRSDHEYIYCPFSQNTYKLFINALLKAKRIKLNGFEKTLETGKNVPQHFLLDGLLPIEILARKDRYIPVYRTMRSIGMDVRRIRSYPFVFLSLRRNSLMRNLYSLVGFQTNLKHGEQKRVFRMIPGLEKAVFVGYGQIHRDTFINPPHCLFPTLQCKMRKELFFAGQITGMLGYLSSVGTGLLAGLNISRLLKGEKLLALPRTTMLGALCYYVTHTNLKAFQPMSPNFEILPSIKSKQKADKVKRALKALKAFLVLNDRSW